MSYSIKKAGVPFVPKINVDPDLTGKADNFSIIYINDNTKDETQVDGDFVESTTIPGLYFAPAITINDVGSYTINIANDTDGLGNVSSPVVVTQASIDDVNTAITNLQTTADSISSEVDGLNGESLTDIKNTLTKINDLIKDTTSTLTIDGDETANILVGSEIVGDNGGKGTVESVSYDGTNTIIILRPTEGTFEAGENIKSDGNSITGAVVSFDASAIDSVMEFVDSINDALKDGASGLSALSGFTDDIENMLLGTQYLADGVTENPFYDENNPGVAKESTLKDALATLQTDISNGVTTVTDAISNQADASVEGTLAYQIAAVKSVVDANKTTLEDSGYGLEALAAKIDDLSSSDNQDVLDELANDTYGLSALQTLISGIDTKVDNLDTKLDTINSNTKRAYAFV